MACLLQLQQGGYLAKQDGNGFLLLNVCNDVPQGGGGKPSAYMAADYKPLHVQKAEYEARQRKLQAEQESKTKQIARTECRIDKLEEKRKANLADQQMQANLLALILKSEQLKAERDTLIAALTMFVREQDDIMVLLLSLPFVN